MDRSPMSMYGHDLRGALVRGYARRARAAARTLIHEAAGWSDPEGVADRRVERGVSMGHHALLEEAIRAGLSEERVAQLVAIHVDENAVRNRQRAIEREPQEHTEDPASGADWESYDAKVDNMKVDDLRRALKIEARLRFEAQKEAGIT